MKKSIKYFLVLFIIFIIIIGFIIPLTSQRFYQIDPFLEKDDAYKHAVEPFQVFILAIKQIDNNGRYSNRCEERSYKQVLLQTYSWMMIKGSVIEVCVALDETGKFLGTPSFGRISSN